MKKLDLSIGILAWKNIKTLEKTLNTFLDNGLLDIVEDITIFFQEISKEDIALAKKYNIKYIENPKNIGIANGFISLAKNASQEYILLLEHDWNLIENNDITYERLKSGIVLLSDGEADVVRYRHRENPGYPHYSFSFKGKELEYYDDWHKCTSPHLLDSLHWLDPAKQFPDKITKKGEYFITTSRYGNWTNNPAIYKKQFYLDIVTPLNSDGINLEKNIAEWWPRQNFIIAHGEGLFSHNDFVKYPPKKKNLWQRFIEYFK